MLLFLCNSHINAFQQTTLSSTGMRNLLDVPVHRMVTQLETAKAQAAKSKNAKHAAFAPDTEHSLWVDRYRPTRFTDLVGNERVARDILAWIKQWDYCVFGKRNIKGKKRARDDENVNTEDEFRRPQEKVCWRVLSLGTISIVL